jgi:hypothetical protein
LKPEVFEATRLLPQTVLTFSLKRHLPHKKEHLYMKKNAKYAQIAASYSPSFSLPALRFSSYLIAR